MAFAMDQETTIITRGVLRLLRHRGVMATVEVDLPGGRRADVFGIDAAGLVSIVEIKTSPADLRRDGKWPEYAPHCDLFYFAVPEGFPMELLPDDTGIIVADRFGGEILSEAPRRTLAPATRKSLTVRFGRLCALRLARAHDPDLDA